jgi:hypothetical protein
VEEGLIQCSDCHNARTVHWRCASFGRRRIRMQFASSVTATSVDRLFSNTSQSRLRDARLATSRTALRTRAC